MVGDNRNRWTSEQLKLLVTLVEGYEARHMRVRWDEVTPKLGHPKNSCQQMLWRMRNEDCYLTDREKFQELRAEIAARPKKYARRRAAKPQAAPPTPMPATPPPAPPEFLRATSTAKFQMDAELRSRIETQGVTAGLLGDPLPGRSALDQKRGVVA